MGYNQWIEMTIKSDNFSMGISNTALPYGKFYEGSKEHEKNIDYINSLKIYPDKSYKICSCGREDSPSGTEGSFCLIDLSDNGAKVATVSWDCPWSGDNTWSFKLENGYMATAPNAVKPGGAIGSLDIEIFSKKPSK